MAATGDARQLRPGNHARRRIGNGGRGLRYDVLRDFACRDGADALRLNAYLAYDEERARHDPAYRGNATSFHFAMRNVGFKVIENLGSHGVGRALHEAPEHIAGYFDPTDQRVLTDGMVITIEPSSRRRAAS